MPLNFKVLHRLGGGKCTELTTTSHVKIENSKYTLAFKNPPNGSIFELQWDWHSRD